MKNIKNRPKKYKLIYYTIKKDSIFVNKRK